MGYLRKIVFYIFLITYIILCPLIVLYVFGYIFETKQQEIIRTGVVYLASLPDQASIYLKKSRFLKKTPATIRGLLPGDYSIKVILKNYEPWDIKFTIEAGKAVTFDKILLTPIKWRNRELLFDSFKDIRVLPQTNFILLKEDTKTQTFFVYDWTNNKIWPLFPQDSPYYSAKVIDIYFVDSSQYLLADVYLGKVKKMLKIQINSAENIINDITKFFEDKSELILWDSDNTDSLYSLYNGNLDQINIRSGEVENNYLENIQGLGVNNKKIYVLKEDSTLIRYNADKSSKEVLLADPDLGSKIFSTKSFYQIFPLSDTLLVFLNQRGELTTNLFPYLLAKSAVLDFSYDQQQKKLLFWQKNAISFVDFSGTSHENGLFQKGVKTTALYKKGKNIKQCFFIYDASHVLFLDQNEVFLIEIFDSDNLQFKEVVKVKQGSSIFYSEDNGTLYYLEAKTGSLQSVEIIPGEQTAFDNVLQEKEKKEEKKER